MYDTLYAILNKSENSTLIYSIFCKKVFGEKYELKLNNAFQTSTKRFVETPPICLLTSVLCSLLCLKLHLVNYASVHVQNPSECVSLNIFYCQNNYSNGVGSQVLTTLVSTLPLHSIYTQ